MSKVQWNSQMGIFKYNEISITTKIDKKADGNGNTIEKDFGVIFQIHHALLEKILSNQSKQCPF